MRNFDLESFICLFATLSPLVYGCADDGGVDAIALDAEVNSPTQSPNEVLTRSSPVHVEARCDGMTGVYCVTIHLKDGAKLKPFLASAPLDTGGMNDCRGWSNQFLERTVKQFTALDLSYDGYNLRDARVIISGSYSNDLGKPAFPQKVKAGGWISTYGYECKPAAGADDMWILQIRNSHRRAFIEPFNLSKFNDPSSAPEAIVGLGAYFDKGDGHVPKGRNFVGLTNPHNDGYGTVVFVIAAQVPGITLNTAVTILKNKGCPESQIMQLDGSTVAQLSHRTSGSWQHAVMETRNMPQVFGVFAP